jgi:taurine dioxygenase
MSAIGNDLKLRPLSDALGVEVSGIDLAQPITKEDANKLSAALDEHTVLLFRNQKISEADQVNLANIFGEPSLRSRPDSIRVEENEYARAIGLVTNIRKDGVPIGSLPDGEMWFHHDGCFIDAPYRATMLYALQVPDRGGDTQFLNMYRAYELLPASIKSALKDRICLHIFDYKTLSESPDPGMDLEGVRHARHPAVIRHPNTGKTALYINPLLTARIEGLPRDESDQIIKEVCRYIENDSLIYAHKWQPYDMLIWDNWGSVHARTDFPADQTRLMRRSIVKGQPLKAA